MKVKQKILSFLLVLTMLVTVFPGGMKAEAAVSASTVIANATALVDKYPYVSGGYSPSQGGFDCSGFVYYVYHTLSGINITLEQAGRSKSKLAAAGTKITGMSNFRPADIIQFNYAHVAIYIGNNQIVEAAKPGTRIRIRTVYASEVAYAVRLPQISGDTPAPVGTTSAPSISVNEQTVTVSWTYNGSATGFDIYLIQAPWTWEAVKYRGSAGQFSRSCTFSNVAPGEYQAFTIARPNSDSVQSPTSYVYVASHTHSWDGGRIATAPTETSTGIRTFTCTGCGATKTEVVPKLPHTHQWDGGRVTKEATVLKTGEMVYTCTSCGQTKKETIPILTRADGKCGDNVAWSYNDETKTLTLSGTGPTYSYTPFDSWDSLPFASNAIHYKAEKIIISPGITTIGGRLFDSFSSVTSISIPTSVKLIGQSAFYRWWGLKDITIPNGIVDQYAFGGESVRGRGPGSIHLEEGVTEVGKGAFFGCPNASIIYIPKSLKSVGVGAFQFDSVKEIYYGGSESGWKALDLQSRPGFRDDTIIYFAEVDPSQTGFSDVPASEYYVDAVKWAVDNGITSGTDKTHFSPNASCTRAQAVTFLWRAAGEPEPAGAAASFKDVKAGSYYEKAVQWAVEQNITGGTGDGKFSPETACSRAQIVTFLWRKEGSPETSGSAFSDVKAGEYYETAVKWAVANEITGGTGNGKFSPDARCARGQIVTFLYRYAN